MKAVKINKSDSEATIETETDRSFLGIIKLKPKKRIFFTDRRIVGDFWEWLELPDKTLVEDRLSFQLDVWLRQSDK
jgi:hypothetical protein